MSSGNITRRGKKSWRVKYEVGRDTNGRRQTRYITVRGTKRDAQKALINALHAVVHGTHVDPTAVTVAEYVRGWLAAPGDITPKTAERYVQLAEQQIIPHLGAIALQKLRPIQVKVWHATLLAQGGKDGRPLAARTVGHAHRVLHRALALAAESEIVARNVASLVKPPKVEDEEVEILDATHVAGVLKKIADHNLYPVAALSLATGLRRGELCALQWRDLDLDAAALTVRRALEETAAGLRFKMPKSKHGRRTVSLPPSAVAMLRGHRRKQLEMRVALGQGRQPHDALVFCRLDGSPMSPDNISRDWRRLVLKRKLPKVTFHALRHSHASALIAAGLDVVSVSRRLGHGSPTVTLNVYAHLFRHTDAAAAEAIENAMRTGADG